MLQILDSAEFWKAASVLLGIIAGLAGYIIKDFRAEVKELKARCADNDDRLNRIESVVNSVRVECGMCRSEIKGDLIKGERRFERIEAAVEKMSESMHHLSVNVAVACEKMGWSTEKCKR